MASIYESFSIQKVSTKGPLTSKGKPVSWKTQWNNMIKGKEKDVMCHLQLLFMIHIFTLKYISNIAKHNRNFTNSENMKFY